MPVLLKCSVCGKLRRVRMLSDRGNICVACRRSLERRDLRCQEVAPEAREERIQTRGTEALRHAMDSGPQDTPSEKELQVEDFSLREPKQLIRDKRLDQEWLEYTKREIGPIGKCFLFFGIAQCALSFGLAVSAVRNGSPSTQDTQEKLALAGAMLFLGSIVILGSIAMIKVKLWWLALAGCVCSMIPLSFCWLPGFCLGLYGLIELGQTEIKASFVRNGNT
jgi:hypothetical protein